MLLANVRKQDPTLPLDRCAKAILKLDCVNCLNGWLYKVNQVGTVSEITCQHPHETWWVKFCAWNLAFKHLHLMLWQSLLKQIYCSVNAIGLQVHPINHSSYFLFSLKGTLIHSQLHQALPYYRVSNSAKSYIYIGFDFPCMTLFVLWFFQILPLPSLLRLLCMTLFTLWLSNDCFCPAWFANQLNFACFLTTLSGSCIGCFCLDLLKMCRVICCVSEYSWHILSSFLKFHASFMLRYLLVFWQEFKF